MDKKEKLAWEIVEAVVNHMYCISVEWEVDYEGAVEDVKKLLEKKPVNL